MNHMTNSALSTAAGDAALVSAWLQRFEAALTSADAGRLAALFAPESHWRDLLAFTWNITPHEGAADIAAALVTAAPATGAHDFALADGRTPPRRVKRLGIEVIEALFTFSTRLGRGDGVLRLPAESPSQAWVLLTTLEELTGFEEKTGKRRPSGEAYSRNFGGDNWLDQREKAEAFADRDPVVLVIGAGQAGLGVAARLGQLALDT
ncbi:MAG: NAD(P)/FAD-dependent oxidoreductase, partial [Roseomonas sp.]|nr:NAD(P)/FAD-dependent oxidoreductase [Roseomonas sp.]